MGHFSYRREFYASKMVRLIFGRNFASDRTQADVKICGFVGKDSNHGIRLHSRQTCSLIHHIFTSSTLCLVFTC